MAGGEIYRVEIPIIVDDQTDKPLQQAEGKVNRFEKSVQKTNERIRKIFGREIMLKISAVDKAWSVIRSVQTRLRGITSKAWNVTLQVKDKVTGTVKNIISKLTSPLALLGAGTGLGAGIIFPLKLAGEFEQAQMSLDFYMGSVEEGKRAFQDLIRFAKETPFEFPFLQGATIQLMGTGYNFEQSKRALMAFGDAAGRTGAGMQGVEAALLGFTQIASAGTLNLQDLKQVALNLKLPLNIFARELGIAESKLGDIGRAGISSKKAMEAIVRTLEQRFKGGMKELSNSLLGMTAVIKDTATLTVCHFGKGMAGPVKRILMDIIGLTDETGGKFEEFQRKLEQLGERVGLKFEQVYGRIKEFWNNLSADPEFQKLDFGDKIIYVINLALDEVIAWLDSEGGMKLQETFVKLGEIGAKAWIAGLKGAFKGAVSSAARGNLVGAGAMLGLASMLGGGMVLRGAWGLGKGLFGAGKWALGKLALGSAGTTAAGVAAETAAATAAPVVATPVAVGVLGKALSTGGTLAGVAGVISGAYDIYQGYKETDPEEARKRYWAGGTKIGMVATGAAIGTAIAPGIGTAIGAGIAGIGALLGGTAIGETLRNVWDSFVSWGSEAWEEVKKSAGSAWDWIKENFTLESIGEKAGCVVGYLESTIFSSEWWLGHWESVKGWASEKWDEMKTVWETVKEAISSTLFSKDWWGRQWESVKSWASNALSGIVARWESLKASFAAGREAGRRDVATKYAIGGILTRPHLGMVAEAGPEAIIPLSARMRARAMDLWLETGRRLGVRPYEEGGFAGAFTPSLATPGPATINLNFDLTGLVGQVVIENREDIDGVVDRIADTIANNLRSVFQNMTK